jgi:MFS superfamily sulfate permease-like transporter
MRTLLGGHLKREVVAGISLAAVGIPISMGVSTVAHMPLAAGLYSMVLPALIYAVFGSSRHLSVSADSASAAILAAGLLAIASGGSSNYVALAGLVAAITGAMLLAARYLKLGFLANFLSRTVLAGFLVGVGIIVAFQQLPKLLGLPSSSATPGPIVADVIKEWSQVSWSTALVGAATLAVLAIGIRFKRVPTELVVIIGGILAASVFGLRAAGVASVGSIHAGLPALTIPHVPVGAWPKLIGTSLSLVVVILAQSSSLARAYAVRYDEPFDADHDLVGLGLANLGATITGTYVVNSSVTKTALKDRLGSDSQAASVVAAAVALVAVFTATGLLSKLPVAVLAAVVLWVALGMVHVQTLKELYLQRRDEFIIAVITAVGVIWLGIEYGVLLSIILCLLNHVRHGYNPKNHLITIDEHGHWVMHAVGDRSEIAPGVFLYRFQAALYYANVEKMLDDVRSLCVDDRPECICLDFSAITDVDFTSGQTLVEMATYLEARNVRLAFLHISDEVKDQLVSSGLQACRNVEFDTHLRDLIATRKLQADPDEPWTNVESAVDLETSSTRSSPDAP